MSLPPTFLHYRKVSDSKSMMITEYVRALGKLFFWALYFRAVLQSISSRFWEAECMKSTQASSVRLSLQSAELTALQKALQAHL